jgi:RNA-directed DNA polymerase
MEDTMPAPSGSAALGVRPRLANNTAGSGLGLARAKALFVGLSNAYFKSLGLPTLIDGC